MDCARQIHWSGESSYPKSTPCAHFWGRGHDYFFPLTALVDFFSDSDWELRLAFWEHVPSIFAFVGSDLAEAYIMPEY